MNDQANGARPVVVRRFWFPGYTFHATLGSRTQNTDTIKNGYAMCFDPEAVSDGYTAPTSNANAPTYSGDPTATYPTDATYKAKMQIKGAGADKLYTNICKPFTGGERLFAGVITGLPSEGLLGTLAAGSGGYVGGVWIDLIVEGFVRAWCKANSTYGASSLGVNVAAGTDGYALVVIDTTTATNNQLVCARAALTHDTSTTAAYSYVHLGSAADKPW